MDPAVPPSSALLPVVVTDEPAPMSSGARARRMAPFALLAASVFPIALWSGAHRPELLPAAALAFVGTVALVVAVPWHRLPGSARMLPAATFAGGASGLPLKRMRAWAVTISACRSPSS